MARSMCLPLTLLLPQECAGTPATPPSPGATPSLPAPVLDTPSNLPERLWVSTPRPALTLRIDARRVTLVQDDGDFFFAARGTHRPRDRRLTQPPTSRRFPTMRTIIPAGLASLTMALALSGCQPPAEPPAPPEAAADAEAAAPAWPASLPVFGDGFPNPGDACRRVGESEATVDFLDHSASLAGCLAADDAMKLGGTVVAVIDGVTLVSVPTATAVPGDGDGQGDAMVAGTPYHATAQIPCSGYQGAAVGMCEAGVVRNTETGTYVEVKLPDGVQRTIFFNADGSFLSFSIAEADGTAAMAISASREGDTTIAILGTERYDIPDAFVMGD